MKNLTKQQKKFCDEYLIDPNAARAAIRAGYSPKTAEAKARQLLAMAEAKAYMEGQVQQLNQLDEDVASIYELLAYLTGILRGESDLQKGPDEKDRLKACELLGKRYGMFTDKVNLQGSIPIVISGGNDLED